MKFAILGFKNGVAKTVVESANPQVEFSRMTAAGEVPEGCDLIELWSDRGRLGWFFGEPKKKESKMKKVLSALTIIAALLFVTGAQAQQQRTKAVSFGTVTIAGQAATNVGYVIDCQYQKNVAVQMTHTSSGATTDNITLAYTRSNDGTTYDTTAKLIAIAANGTTTVTTVTNIDSAGAAFIKINYITNAAASAVCTNTVGYLIKSGSP